LGKLRALERVLLLLVCVLAGAAAARAGDEGLCLQAIARVEARGGLPRGLLQAIALTESGHRSTGTAAFGPWPWTANNGGDGRYFDSKDEAIDWVERLLQQKRRNVDLGCMQINLMHHPEAFDDLEEGLDPLTNVTYGARFLMALKDETGSWERAVERYHNAEPVLGAAYRERVYASWDDQRTGSGARTFLGSTRLASAEQGQRRLPPTRTLPRMYPLSRDGDDAMSALRPVVRRPGAPVVLDPRRGVPGAIALTPGRSRPPMMAPAPGRITVLTGSPLVASMTPGEASSGRRVRTASLAGPAAARLD
jgi:hypothetical protein